MDLEMKVLCIFISPLDVGQWSASRSDRFISEKTS